jgi:tripartite-type tricarboxylate transporter receptor subunit TctC
MDGERRRPLRDAGDGDILKVRYKLLIATALIASCAVNASGQEYPTKVIRVIVPFTPGAGNDTQGRLLGRYFQESMGQGVVVENRPGAAGTLGAELVARAPADGYMLLFTTATLAANATLRKSPTFDPLRDLAPISLVSIAPQFLIVHPSMPVHSVRDLVALCQKNPGKLNAGSSGSGSSIHLAIELFSQLAGVKVTHVPYKGGTQAFQAVLAGEVDFNFQGAVVSLPAMRAGKVRGLAVTTAKPSAAAPDVPTVASVLPGFESVNWFGLYAPVGTPVAIVAKLNAETVKALKAPQTRELLLREGIEPIGSTAPELATYLRNDVERTAKLIKAANIQVE